MQRGGCKQTNPPQSPPVVVAHGCFHTKALVEHLGSRGVSRFATDSTLCLGGVAVLNVANVAFVNGGVGGRDQAVTVRNKNSGGGGERM